MPATLEGKQRIDVSKNDDFAKTNCTRRARIEMCITLLTEQMVTAGKGMVETGCAVVSMETRTGPLSHLSHSSLM